MPDEYNTTLEYEGVTYTIDNEKYYKICKGKKDQKAICELETVHYDDGTDKKHIVNITGISES